jgi:hypothetical protein
MTQDSLHDLVEDLLNQAHQTTAIGRWMASSPEREAADDELPDAFAESLEFLFKEARTLEAIVLRLASEVDALRPARLVSQIGELKLDGVPALPHADHGASTPRRVRVGELLAERPPRETYRCPFAYAGRSLPPMATVLPISGLAACSVASTRSRQFASASPCSRSLAARR